MFVSRLRMRKSGSKASLLPEMPGEASPAQVLHDPNPLTATFGVSAFGVSYFHGLSIMIVFLDAIEGII